jgi:diguanylate cyclase (GGDEF)-like protein
MSLRLKTFLLVTLSLAGLFIGLCFTSFRILNSSFHHLEEKDAKENVARVEDALQENLRYIDGVVASWALWDEAYKFMQGKDPAFVAANLSDGALEPTHADVIIFAQPSGRIVFGTGYDRSKSRRVPLWPGIKEHVVPGSKLLHPPTQETGLKGIVMTPRAPLLVVSRVVSTNNAKAPGNGVLIMGRFLRKSEIDKISAVTHLPLSIYRLDKDPLPADFQMARAHLSSAKPFYVQPLNRNMVGGYTYVKDISGKQVLLLRADGRRDAFQQGRLGITSLIISLLVLSGMFGLVTWFIIERVVLSRVSHLSQDVERITSQGNASARVEISGRDELTQLMVRVNDMLSALDRSQQHLQRSEAALEESNKQLAVLAVTDSLTQVSNRRAFDESLEREVLRAWRYHQPLSLVMMDIDRFKSYNDSYGHPAGDEILKMMGQVLQQQVREYDLVARYGGEEFVVLLPNTTLDAALIMADRFRTLIETTQWPRRPITGSFGVACLSASLTEAEELIAAADAALYASKQHGRNRVTQHGLPNTTSANRPR